MKACKRTKSLSSPEAAKNNAYNLPSHNALAQILPNNHYIFKEVKTKIHKETQQHLKKPAERPEATPANKPNINHTYQIHHPHKRPPLHVFKDDPSMAEISSLQTKEVENYRSAMSQMAEDIIVLRTQVVTLEAENSQLRIDLSLHQGLQRDQLNDSDIDTMTNAEISKHIASLKLKVASEIRKAASQRERIHQLQNDLIKKNDSEKELLKLQRVYKQQHEDQQNCLAKIATLEGTVKQQEKVIEKMEKALNSKLDRRVMIKKQRGENDKTKEKIESALAEENTCLREEPDRSHKQPNPVFMQQSEQTKDTLPLNERLQLLHRVEQAEERVQTLEAQLEENSKQWGREKQQMMTRLSEHRHGFVRTSTTTIFHSDPSRSKSGSLYQQSRERSQKPIYANITLNC